MKKFSLVIFLCSLLTAHGIAQCVANFSASVNNTTQYGFIDISTGTDGSTTYSWSFGDGGTSTLQNPPHTFAGIGTYIVCETINVVDQSCTSTHCDTIVITCPAGAGYTYINGTTYQYDFSFHTTSNDQDILYSWNFGDPNAGTGDTSTQRNPVHVFSTTGVFDVCLTVTDTVLHCDTTYCSEVDVCTAQALFHYTNSTAHTFSFTDASFGEDASTTYHWDFGDGDTSNVQNPTYTFTGAGQFTVCLTIDIQDIHCTNMYCTTISVACGDSAHFTYSSLGGLTYQFTDQSTGEDSTTTYSWSFGDGTTSGAKNPVKTYGAPATNDICLTIDNVDQGCISTYCANIVDSCNVSAHFTSTVSGVTVNFTDGSLGEDTTTQWAWDFGDGTTDTVKNPIHAFTSVGSFHVCLTITVDHACTSTICADVVTTCPAYAQYTFTNADSVYTFTDASSGEDVSTTYSWSFGDGGTAATKDATHTYHTNGNYQVCLTIDDVDFSCTSQFCQNMLVNVNGCPDTAHFTFSNTNGDYNFTDASVGESNSANYLWRFGDGDTAVTKNPAHTYTASGIYFVCLTVTDPNNSCSNESCDSITVVVAGINSVAATVNNIKVYPNPTSGLINIEMNGASARHITLFDNLGREVLQTIPAKTDFITINISQLPAGMYVVRITTETGLANIKLVLSK